jgi:very-short-patch-repair endonuclease
VTVERVVPVTTVPRTLFDLASVLPRRHLERAINEAEIRQQFDSLSLPDLLNRYPRRRGAAVIEAILADGVVVTRSDLEAAFLAFVEERELPFPEVNSDLFVGNQWLKPDCLWRRDRVIVELDGRAIHRTSAAFERDRIRDRTLQVNGWRVIRVTGSQLRSDRDRLAYELRAILSSSMGTAPWRRTSQASSVS